MEKLKALDKKTPHETSWVPIVWAINLLTSADNSDKHSLRIESPVFANLLKGIDKIEANNRKLLNYGWVNFPLAYTQVIMTPHFTFGTTGTSSHLCRNDYYNTSTNVFKFSHLQVATIAVLTYFASALLGRQFLIPSGTNNEQMFPNSTISYSSKTPFNLHSPDFKIPLHTLIELVCYMGWIKVAETLLNPFGDDDEDFNVNYLIDRNLQV